LRTYRAFDESDIFLRFFRKLVEASTTTNVCFPAIHVLDHRCCFVQSFSDWEAGGDFTIYVVCYANRHPFHIGHYIQLCYSNFISTLYITTIFGGWYIEGSYSSRPSCGSSVLTSRFPKKRSFFTKK